MEFTAGERPQTPRQNYVSVRERKLPEGGVFPFSLVQYSGAVEWDPQERLIESEDHTKLPGDTFANASETTGAKQASGGGESAVVVPQQLQQTRHSTNAPATTPRKPETTKSTRHSSRGVSRTQKAKWMVESQGANQRATDSYTRRVVRQLVSTQQWKDSYGRHWRRHPFDEYHPQREDCILVEKHLDEELRRRQARPTPLCPTREALYAQLFDEMIRQITLICPERGMLLTRIRDEAYLTLAEYDRISRIGSREGGREIQESNCDPPKSEDASIEDVETEEQFAQIARGLREDIRSLKTQTDALLRQHSRLKEFYDNQSASRKEQHKKKVQRLEEEEEDLESFISQLGDIRQDVWRQVEDGRLQAGK
eukprot:gb/GECG01000064.1/.p1 GENE.gb/GECG01000064.1/~~gb/GECG01000064.1/.p1  ORF type:complete len:368 (+),score=56.15 gb/GECG01000064.1/:1-1104(+)